MFQSIRTRLFLTYLLIISLVLVVIGVSLTIFLLRNPVVEQFTYRRMEASLGLLTNRGDRILADSALADRRLLDRLDELSDFRAILVSGGELVGDSRSGDHSIPASVLNEAQTSPTSLSGSYRVLGEGRWLYVSQPLATGEVLVLIAPRPNPLALRTWGDDLLRPLLQAGLLGLLCSVLLSWLFSRWVAAPLKRISRASDAIAEGDYSPISVPQAPTEVRSLALSFNEMAEQVQNSRAIQRDFVANVSHELRTPLTSIRGFAQAILDGTASDADSQGHAAKVILDEADRLRRLVDDLLELARLDSGQIVFARERVDLNALIAAVVERLSPRAAEAGVTVKYDPPGFPDLIGDGDRLAQVFTNLLDNAIKYSGAGGQVRVWGETAEAWVTAHIDDSGPGIPPEELSRIFERFYQLDKARSGRGAGLGLAITHEIVRGHDGHLVAQSSPGKGSRFSVQLPIARPGDRTLVADQG